MKACWLFSRRIGSGTQDDPFRPSLDAFPGRWTSPGDIVKLSGPSAQPHQHLLVGGIGLPDDNLGDGHRHYLVKSGGRWFQAVAGGPEHVHDMDVDASDNPVPSFYLVFWAGADAVASALESDNDNFPIVYGQVDEETGSILSLDNSPWSPADLSLWRVRVLNVLGLQLPDDVDRGSRLVLLFLGALLSRQAHDETKFRFS